MKNYLLAICAILLIVSLFGTIKSFTSPTKVTVQQQVTTLSFKQDGAFDYTVNAKPAYFYDNVMPATTDTTESPTLPQQAPIQTPQIPINFIKSFNMSFNYSSSAVSSENIEIDAVLSSAGLWTKTVNLVPQTNYQGNTTVPFAIDLSSFQTLVDKINSEIGLTSTKSYSLTIQATMSEVKLSSGGIEPDSIQTLPITVNDTFVMMGNDLISKSSDAIGTFNYQVQLNANDLFGQTVLTPPTPSAELPDEVLTSADTIFINLIDSMQVSYNYKLTANQVLSGETTEVEIDAILSNQKVWSKTYVLVPPTSEEGNFTINFPLDINSYIADGNIIQQETGTMNQSLNFTLQATVQTTGPVTAGSSLDKPFVQSITTNLSGGVLSWTSALMQSDSGTIKAPMQVNIAAKLFGLPVIVVRIVSLVILFLIVILLVLYFFVVRPKASSAIKPSTQTRQANQKYKEFIVEVKERPQQRMGESLLTVNSLDELIKVAQAVLKPINHVVSENLDVYWLTDGNTRYEYKNN